MAAAGRTTAAGRTAAAALGHTAAAKKLVEQPCHAAHYPAELPRYPAQYPAELLDRAASQLCAIPRPAAHQLPRLLVSHHPAYLPWPAPLHHA